MMRREFPILEFDEDRNAMIRPENILQPVDIAEGCVLCFFAEAIEKVCGEYPHRIVAYFKSESLSLPIYELDMGDTKVALVQAGVGAPIAAAQIDELTGLGCRRFIVCGSCGVLQKEIAVGHLILPVAAVRDEGTSYHYIEPSREITADERAVRPLEETLMAQGIPYIRAKTWTTDAFYRETPRKVQLRREEGCVTVEMEASAYMAAARYNNVQLGQMLYAGDNLDGVQWDSRSYHSRAEVREKLLRLALEACARM